MGKQNKTISSLSKRLGELDAERRKIIKELKSSPEYGLKYLKDKLESFTATNSVKWFSRTGEKAGTSYWRMLGFNLNTTPSQANITITDRKSAILVSVEINWEAYLGGSSVKTPMKETIKISAFNELEGQILNGRKLATDFEEKKLVKAALTEKKKLLEDQLKSIKDDLAKFK